MQPNQAIKRTLEAEDLRFKALSNNDIAAIEGMIAEDLHYVHANAAEEDKVEFMRKITSGERRYRSLSPIKRTSFHENGFTFIFGEVEMEVELKTGLVHHILTYTAVYRDAETPKLLAWHSTKIVS